MKKLYATALIIGLCALPHLSARAESPSEALPEPPQIFISEINWAGSANSTADEWIELFNATSESVDLSGWILTGAATNGDALSIADGFTIESSSAALIANYPFEHEKTTLNIAPDLVTSALSLPNSSIKIMLTTPDGLVVDEVTKDDRAGGTDPVVSMTRLDDMTWAASTDSVNLLDLNQLGTPGVHVMNAPEAPSEQTEPDVAEDTATQEDLPPLVYGCPTTTTQEGSEEDTDVESADPLENEETNSSPEPEQVDVTEVSVQPTFTPAPSSTSTLEPEPDLSYPHTLQLNEIVSDPEDGTEWVEILNTGNEVINLLDFGLMDGSGKLTTFPAVELNPRDFYIVEDPAGNLNNAGDSVHLFDPSGFIIDEMSYGDDLPAPDKGESLARFDDEWIITSIMTRSEENRLPAPEVTGPTVEEALSKPEEAIEPKQETEINVTKTQSEIEVLDEETKTHKVVAIANQPKSTEVNPSKKQSTEKSAKEVTMTGTVTALPGTFGNQIAFINGTQVYFYHADWPYLEIGDLITITGEPSESRGEDRIKISSAENIEVLNSVELTALKSDVASLATAKAGSLIQITGNLIEQNGDHIVLKDASGEVEIVIHKNTGINLKGTGVDGLIVTGVIRKFGDTVKVYPRSQADIAALESKEASSDDNLIAPIARAQAKTPWIGGGLAAGAVAAVAYWYAKHRFVLRTA